LADYLADSYALVAFLEGNDRYVRIFRSKTLATTALNVLEVYATLLKRVEVEVAKEVCSGLLPLTVSVPAEVALLAGDFRHQMRSRKRDCSYIDAWGYAAARRLGVRFLTGDPSFRGIDHVEFVR
jgi:predicted nucleic acid-binding protein